MCNYSLMPKKNDRDADDRALDRNNKKNQTSSDARVKGLGKLIGINKPKKDN